MEALDLPIEAFLEAQRLVRRLNRESRTVSPQRQEGYSLSLEQTSYISDQPFDEGASELETSESDRLAREIGRRVADLVLYLVDRRL